MTTTASIRVVVYHANYGCESGCCGHVVEVDGHELGFMFSHPYGDDAREWALELAREECSRVFGEGHVVDLDWDNCYIADY